MEIQRVKLDFRALKILMYIDVSTHTHTHAQSTRSTNQINL